MDRMFYVYKWFNTDTDEVFYIGKGKGERYNDTVRRNKYFKSYYKKYRCDVTVIHENLTEEEAFAKEVEIIKHYKELGQAKTNLSDGGEGCSGYKHTSEALKKMSYASKGKNNPMYKIKLKDRMSKEKYDNWITKQKNRTGIKNSQYGVSPKERMDEETYKQWIENHRNIIGDKNPNYGNDTLKKKYTDNPELAKEKQSRPAEQNGRATPIAMYNEDGFYKEFSYIGECADYCIDNRIAKAKINSIRASIWKSIKTNLKYKGYKFKYV